MKYLKFSVAILSVILSCTLSSCGQEEVVGQEKVINEEYLSGIATSVEYSNYFNSFDEYLSASRALSEDDLSAIEIVRTKYDFTNIFDHTDALKFISMNAPNAIGYYKALYNTDLAYDKVDDSFSIKSLSSEKRSLVRELYKAKVLGREFRYDAEQLRKILEETSGGVNNEK